MMSRKLFWVGVLVAFLMGSLGGLVVGVWRGHQAGMALILNSALAKDARDVETRIEVLGRLRSGEVDQAISTLETGMDDVLVGFDPADPYPGLEAGTVQALGRAIDRAREYRSAHPWGPGQEMRAGMVRSLFERDLYPLAP